VNLLQMFWRFAELSQPVDYTLGDSTETHALMMRERADLVRDIPEEIRRLMALAETPPESIGKPDAGDGWRFLEEGEIVQYGDELRIRGRVDYSWAPCFTSIGMTVSAGTFEYRRRVEVRQ
jgi:hypothetical protein